MINNINKCCWTTQLNFTTCNLKLILCFLVYLTCGRTAAQLPSSEYMASKRTVACSRNFTCDKCSPSLLLTPEHFLRAARNTHVVFVGDSVTAQVECDYRQALSDGEAVAINESSTGAYYPSLSASSRFITIGCPWRCKNSTNERLFLEKTANNLAYPTTHVVFNLGSHYSVGRLKAALDNHREFLLHLKDKGIKVLIRTLGVTHFPSSSGDYASFPHKSTDYVCTRARNPMKSIIIPQNTYLTGLAQNISADIIDITGLSDDHLSHPTLKNGKYTRDCRHICQNCGMLRSWNSLTIRYF